MSKDWQSITQPTGIEAEKAKYRHASTSKTTDVDLDGQYVVVLAKVPKAASADDFASVKNAVLNLSGVESADAVADVLVPDSIVEGGKFAIQVHTRLRVVEIPDQDIEE